MQRVQLFLLIRLIDLPQTPTKCGLGSQRRDTNIFGSKRVIQIFGEPEHISVGARRTIARFSENQSTVLREPEHGSLRTRERFSENQSTVLREPEHGSPRTRARSLRTRSRFSENQSTVLREPEHSSPRTGARFSENQSAPKLENRKTSPCSPRAPILLHVLPSRMVGWNELCNPASNDDRICSLNLKSLWFQIKILNSYWIHTTLYLSSVNLILVVSM